MVVETKSLLFLKRRSSSAVSLLSRSWMISARVVSFL